MPARVIMSVCACNPPPPILLFRREQIGRWNITVLLLLPYLMTAVIATVWCSLAVCVTAFDPGNNTHKFSKHTVCATLTQNAQFQKAFLESLKLCAVASCVIMHQADDLSGTVVNEEREWSQCADRIEWSCQPSSVVTYASLSQVSSHEPEWNLNLLKQT